MRWRMKDMKRQPNPRKQCSIQIWVTEIEKNRIGVGTQKERPLLQQFESPWAPQTNLSSAKHLKSSKLARHKIWTKIGWMNIFLQLVILLVAEHSRFTFQSTICRIFTRSTLPSVLISLSRTQGMNQQRDSYFFPFQIKSSNRGDLLPLSTSEMQTCKKWLTFIDPSSAQSQSSVSKSKSKPAWIERQQIGAPIQSHSQNEQKNLDNGSRWAK